MFDGLFFSGGESKMATQGLITVCSGNQVVMKIVAGSDGYNAQILSDFIKSRWPLSAEDAYELALTAGFGSIQSLVVLTADNECHQCDDELPVLYRDTFDQPRFNPRWSQGTADYTIVINV